MAKESKKKKRGAHNELLGLLQKHFKGHEEEGEDQDEDMEPMEKYDGMKAEKEKGNDDNKLSKDKRKKLAVMVISKRSGRKRKAM